MIAGSIPPKSIGNLLKAMIFAKGLGPKILLSLEACISRLAPGIPASIRSVKFN